MMKREWEAILSRYGSPVTVVTGEERRELRAFLQPVLDRGEGQRPSPLGLVREDRHLYLGPAEVPLKAGISRVEWQGQEYEVQAAHPVGGRVPHHWWGILLPREEESL